MLFSEVVGLDAWLQQAGEDFYHSLTEQHVHLFSPASLSITAQQFAQMHEVIAAIGRVVRLPGWAVACGLSPQGERQPLGVCYGYDFHLNAQGAHLIEINTNAGGEFLNTTLLKGQARGSPAGELTASPVLEQDLIDMFFNEWRLVRGDAVLKVIAIIDEQPRQQYLYPEFLLARQLFERAGLRAFIADPADFEVSSDGLYLQGMRVDMIYNRLTDFSLGSHPALLQAYQYKQVVLTPHPAAYMQYADKRNLAKLGDVDLLRGIGTEEADIKTLETGLPQTRLVKAEDADQWWATRKQWFFKPMSGYGAKGAYRGDKITKRVFDEILAGGYVAQTFAPPGEVTITQMGEHVSLKYDVRCYVYDGLVQLIAARFYQGQTTNFRTPGGGFGLVRVQR